MENVTVFSLSDKCEINMSAFVLSSVSLMNLTVKPILNVALINIPGTKGSWNTLWEMIFYSLLRGFYFPPEFNILKDI